MWGKKSESEGGSDFFCSQLDDDGGGESGTRTGIQERVDSLSGREKKNSCKTFFTLSHPVKQGKACNSRDAVDGK